MSNGAQPEVDCHAFLPEARAGRSPWVFVHGAGGRPLARFRALLPYAMRANVTLLAPQFQRPAFRGFQRLAGEAGPLAAAEALERAVAGRCFDERLDAWQMDLIGFSGGAQFAHRYALLYPERVRRLVVASAGWYTWLDPAQRFPRGLAPGRSSGARVPDVDGFLQLPMRVLVGELDTSRDALLRSRPGLDEQQGGHRLARAVRWVEHLNENAARRGIATDIRLELLPGTGHSFSEALARGDMARRISAFLAMSQGAGASPSNGGHVIH